MKDKNIQSHENEAKKVRGNNIQNTILREKSIRTQESFETW